MAGEKILIVEDEQDIAMMVDAMMRERGYRTVIAHDGLGGLNLALQERPALILLDLRLPRMNGVQFLSKLHEHQPHTPVIVVTALGSEALALHALRMGVKDYVKKPFDPTELVNVVERALREGRLRRERDGLTGQLLTSNQQLEQRVRQLTALYQVGQALASTLDLDELLNVILQEACRVLDVSLTSIFLLDERNGDVVFRLGTGNGAERLIGQRLSPGQGVAGWVAKQGEPLLIERVQSDARFSPVFDQITGLTTESILCVPLRVKGRLIGVLEALNKPQGGFTEDDLALLRVMAASAAVAIENARLYQNLRESRDQVAEHSTDLRKVLNRLVRLQRIALALGKLTIGANLRDVYKRLTEHAATLLEVKRSVILLFDPERQELVCQEPAFGISGDAVRDYRISLGPHNPVWDAWERGQSLRINNLAESPLAEALGLGELAAQKGVRSTLFSVLRMGGRSMGLFQVSDKLDGSDFTSDDQQVLEIFASQSAIAIENARLFTSEKHRVSEMETLVEIAQAVTEAVTEHPRALLERIVRGACEVLYADCAVVYPFVATEPDTYDVPNVATFGTLHPLKPGHRVSPDDPVHIVRKHNPLVCEDIARDRPALLRNPFFEQESIRAFVGVLLEADEEELGVLYVNFRTPHLFKEQELTSVRLIAHQAALAISKSRLFETLNRDLFQTNADWLRKLHEMEELQKISNMISSTLEIDKVFDGILQGAVSITGAPHANILMTDEESGAVISRMRRGGQVFAAKIDPREMATVSPVVEGERATRRDWTQAAIVQDVTEPMAEGTPWLSIYRRLVPDARSFLYVPIMSGGERKRIGLLGISSPRPGKFGPDDLRLLEALANQAAIAIQNARYLQTVRVYQEQQVEAERIAAIADVAGNMVHRINNAVGAIRPLIQQIEMKLSRGELDEDYLWEKLQGIRESVENTLDVARQIRRPFQSVLLRPIDVNESIAAAWANLKTPVGVDVKIECGENLPPVKATRQLDEVFRNLMKNALDAMTQEGGLLLVRSRRLDGRQVEVMVKDTGPGIPAEIREKIFRMGITTKPRGTGYGLWWSRMFLRRLGGDMVLESQGDRGCVFRVTLPISEE